MKKTIKRFTVLALALVLMLGMTVTASAASNVTYNGDAQEFIFAPGSEYSPTDLFTDFKGVMPGDELTQEIVVKNDKRGKDLVIIYMRALGAHEGSEDFLSQMNLKVKAVGGDVDMFDAPANEKAQLTEWVSLGQFEDGAEVTLQVSLNVPITMGNDYQQQIGYLDWQFKVEEIPYEEESTGDEYKPGDEEGDRPTDPTGPSDTDEDGDGIPDDEDQDDDNDGIPDEDDPDHPSYKEKDDGVQTGDDSNMMTYMFIALGALAIALIALVTRRKKTEE